MYRVSCDSWCYGKNNEDFKHRLRHISKLGANKSTVGDIKYEKACMKDGVPEVCKINNVKSKNIDWDLEFALLINTLSRSKKKDSNLVIIEKYKKNKRKENDENEEDDDEDEENEESEYEYEDGSFDIDDNCSEGENEEDYF